MVQWGTGGVFGKGVAVRGGGQVLPSLYVPLCLGFGGGGGDSLLPHSDYGNTMVKRPRPIEET